MMLFEGRSGRVERCRARPSRPAAARPAVHLRRCGAEHEHRQKM